MEKVNWKVEGMTCTNCALSVNNFLTEKGMKDVKVNFIAGDVSFEMTENTSADALKKGISGLGYRVAGKEEGQQQSKRHFLASHFHKFTFCAIFTLPLMLHMIPGVHIHWLMNPYLQLTLTIPVLIVGMNFFGRSALKSIASGIPNMNVLITLGSLAAFGYSLYGTLIGEADQYLFYETTATIITLVFLGNWMEDRSVQTTQRALHQLIRTQKTMATMITYDEHHQENLLVVESGILKTGDLVLIKTGEQVPADCKILWGEANVNESIITGESVPVVKKMNDKLIGGSTIESGTIKAYVTAAGEDTVLASIVRMVQDAQSEKPPVQQLADKISAVFVPAVIALAVITLAANYFFGHLSFGTSLLRAIAVLVISCPCAMGLATPAAVAVGLGRAARNGILFKNAKSLEIFKDIRQVIFDKTGTLTTGHFVVTGFQSNISEVEFKKIAFSLEKFSNHPIATAIAKAWKTKEDIRWKKIEEIKGMGMMATDKDGNSYTAGSFKSATALTHDHAHNVYIIRNDQLLGWIDVADEIRPEAKDIITMLQHKGINTILLSGDKKEKCESVATALGIQTVLYEQTPEQKLEKVAEFTSAAPTTMVGDGINDAPALAKATVGISLSDASQIAMQSAQVVLMNHGLKNLPMALGLGKQTYQTIKGNLAWAFVYNIFAIPVAALGYLNPTFGALVMGLSDVVLAINSIRLNFKKVV